MDGLDLIIWAVQHRANVELILRANVELILKADVRLRNIVVLVIVRLRNVIVLVIVCIQGHTFAYIGGAISRIDLRAGNVIVVIGTKRVNVVIVGADVLTSIGLGSVTAAVDVWTNMILALGLVFIVISSLK